MDAFFPWLHEKEKEKKDEQPLVYQELPIVQVPQKEVK